MYMKTIDENSSNPKLFSDRIAIVHTDSVEFVYFLPFPVCIFFCF